MSKWGAALVILALVACAPTDQKCDPEPKTDDGTKVMLDLWCED